jgi:glycosyltransferase involved in cell wall biosynthesis
MALISVIIPVYNTRNELDNCLQSLISQTFPDWECILIDDGSTDGSSETCDHWANRDKRIKTIHKENGGVSSARNRGLDEARGVYITFIDSDDWIDVDYLMHLYDAVRNRHAELIVSGVVQHYYNGEKRFFVASHNVFPLDSNHVDAFVSLNEKFLLYGSCSKLYKKKIIDRIFLRFDEACSYGEDLKFNYAYLDYVSVISSISYAGYHYRKSRGGTLSTIIRSDTFETDYIQWQLLQDFYQRHQLYVDISQRLLFQRLWGIVYDAIFAQLRPSLLQLRHILSIPEITEMRYWQDCFNCASWIKKAILKRKACFLYFYLSFYRKG